MNLHRENVRLESRGNMLNKKEDDRFDGPRMAEEHQDTSSPHHGENFFEIHIKGHLDSSWSDWLGGMEVKCCDNGEMILYGHIRDQAALMGILNKLYGLNLTLLSVGQIDKKNEVYI
jgi:hypothetical protein